MKLFGRFNEMSINQIFLYGVPDIKIAEIIKKYPETEVIIKERTFKPYYKTIRCGEEEETYKINQDLSKRHKVILKQDLGFMTVELHSYGLNSEEIKALNLKPIPAVTKKEKAGKAIRKLNPEARRQIRVKKKNGKYVKCE